METNRDTLDQIQLRSEQVNEVLENPPHWLIRWGSTVLCLLIVLFFTLACIIKYPEFIPGSIVISSQNPPEKIETTVNSRIEKIFINDQQEVKAGQAILVLQSNADYEDVLQLKQLLDSLQPLTIQQFPVQQTSGFRLGEIQEDYTAFAKAVQEEILFAKLKPYDAEGLTAGKNINDYERRIENMKQQYALEESKMQLTEKNYRRSEQLQQQGVISALDLENEKLRLLEERKNFKNTQLSLAQLEESVLNFKKVQTAVQINKSKDQSNYSTGSLLMLEKLRKAILQWERSFLIRASIAGKVSYLQFLGTNQFVKAGTALLSILPEQRDVIVGQMHIAAQNQGKIQAKQRVLIKLDNFKYQEFGIVTGEVKSLSLTPDKDGKYYVEVALPKGLETSYHKKIDFNQELTGNADIVTEELTLAERILNQLRSMLKYQQNG